MESFLVRNDIEGESNPNAVQEEFINNTYRMRVSVPVAKRTEKRFFLNEVDLVNASYIEYSGRVKYVSHSLWDCKIIKVPTITPQHFLYFLVPNEKSGVHVIEEGLENFPLSKLLCQMRVTNLRVRIPSFTIRSQNSPINLTDILGPNNSTVNYENPRLIQNITLEVTDVDMDGDLHENYFRTEDTDDDEDEEDEADDMNNDNNSSAATDEAEDDDDDAEDDDESRESRKKGFRRKYRKVNLDRPFIVYVEDSTVGTVFMGRVNIANPAEAEVPSTSETSSSAEEAEATTVGSVDAGNSSSSSTSTESPADSSKIISDAPRAT